MIAYGPGNCSLSLISDDGVSNDYRKGVGMATYEAVGSNLRCGGDDSRYLVKDFRRVY